MKHIGFTGTRHGMTREQALAVVIVAASYVKQGERWTAHHGDCIGADEGFHDLAHNVGATIVGHPSTHNLRAYREFDVEHDRKAPMVRNADIVRESDVMIACPYEATEQPRGGTWATIRMARMARKPLAIVLPDGTVQRERWPVDDAKPGSAP